MSKERKVTAKSAKQLRGASIATLAAVGWAAAAPQSVRAADIHLGGGYAAAPSYSETQSMGATGPFRAEVLLNLDDGRIAATASASGLSGTDIAGAVTATSDQDPVIVIDTYSAEAGVWAAEPTYGIHESGFYSGVGIVSGIGSIGLGSLGAQAELDGPSHGTIMAVAQEGELAAFAQASTFFQNEVPGVEPEKYVGCSSATVFYKFYDPSCLFTPRNDGDLDKDGQNDAMDAAMMAVAIGGNLGGQSASYFDLNSDSSVDLDDMDALLSTYFSTTRGDANLDTYVDQQDFDVVDAYMGLGGLWMNGDFNADGVVDLNDRAIAQPSYSSNFTTYDSTTHTHSSGTVTHTGSLVVGDVDSAVYNLSAGVVAVNDDLYVGKTHTGNGTLNVSGGSLLVHGNANVGAFGTGVMNQTGGTVTVDGALNIAKGAGARGTYTLSGGTLTVPDIVNNGTFNFTGGTATVSRISGTGTTTVGSGRTLQVSHVRQNTLNVDGTVTTTANGTTTGVSKFQNLNVGSSGVLDLKDNDAIINYSGSSPIGTLSGSAYDGLTGKIASAYDYGAWDGPGITTTMGDATSGLTTLAIAEASDVLFIGSTDTAVWGGQTVDGTSVLIKYTYAGHLNFDGLVDAGDYGIIDDSYQFPGTTAYSKGDINYDGVIDGGDYGIIDNSYQFQGPPITTTAGMGAAAIGVTPVPEPAAFGTVLLAAGLASARRRRRRHASKR